VTGPALDPPEETFAAVDELVENEFRKCRCVAWIRDGTTAGRWRDIGDSESGSQSADAVDAGRGDSLRVVVKRLESERRQNDVVTDLTQSGDVREHRLNDA